MADAQTQMAPTPAIPMATTEDLPLPPPPALEDLPPPPPKESFSKFHQQRQASELRRLYKHIHPELRKNLAEAVAEDLAEVLGSEEPTEGDVQCMRWIFENWRLDAIGDHEPPAAKEPVPCGDVQATSRRFEDGSLAHSVDREPAAPEPPRGDVRAARQLFETKPLDELRGQAEAPEAAVREPAASGDVRGTRMLFETRPLDRPGSRPSMQEQSPLELRSEIQELKGDVKKTVKLFQTEPLCAIQDAEGAIHEVKAACREEIQSNAVRAPERSSVQLLASCIDKGDLNSLHSLRWEPPADPSPGPASEGAHRLPPTESIIHVPPLDPGMGVQHQRATGASSCPSQAAAPAGLQDLKKQEVGRTGQKGTATLGKAEQAAANPPEPAAPDLQAAMQSLRVATAEAQSLHQQMLSKHKQGPIPAGPSRPRQEVLLQAPAPATGAVQNTTRPVAGSDPRIPAAPRKVSGKEKATPTGLPGGWVTIQDGVYTAHPVRTFDLTGGLQSSERELQVPGRVNDLASQVPSLLQGGPGQHPGPGRGEPGDHTQKACGSPGKVMAEGCPGSLQAAETTLKTAPLAHHALASEPQAPGASLHSHNASVPPPPAPSAAVTGPDLTPRACHDEASLQDSPLPSHSSPAGPRTPGGVQMKTPKLEPAMLPRKKPQVPPKPAHLAQMHPPRRLPKPSAPAPSSSLEVQVRQGKHQQGGTEAASPEPVNAPTAADQGLVALSGCPSRQSQPGPQHGLSAVAHRPIENQAMESDAQSPESPKLGNLSSDSTSPRQASSPPGERPMEGSKQGVPESTEILQGSRQELQGLLSQVQALEKEAASSVDVRALRRLFETVPQLEAAASPAPAAHLQPEASVEQAFGELTRVSTEVALLKEQTLARLLDIEEAVHKALSSMSSLQPEANARGHSQGPPKDHGAHVVSVTTSSRARRSCSGQEVRNQAAVKGQGEAGGHTEMQSQAKVTGHKEGKGHAAPTAPPTRGLDTPRGESGLPRVLPSSRDSPSSPTFISIRSATRKLPGPSSPKGGPEVSAKSTHTAQDMGQALPHQKGVQAKAEKKEVTQCSEQPKPALASASPLPTGRQKTVLELQAGPSHSQCYGATRTVTEQYEEMDQFGNTVLTSSTTVTEQAEPSRSPGPRLGLHASPLLRQFLHSPAGFGSGLAEAETAWVPCSHSP
ncbi:Xin actin-binding repeat-containing protein 1 [Tupaia chinensis]|uniref:Xin actin-binding repeat-containing protein 1 n=1 Tax=Tupaia chinensis TaxID=246437 RepID=L8YGA2_TUPCH|nr:Xin actin-binding repeat-containing protein 1 [Tupaia chinensis]